MTEAWHPVAASSDLPPRHTFHGQLLGRELAIWRADDGFVNVWENRCLHRGVRLSIGLNDGRELQCQYHGWRYANRTAGCTYIPAHPADAPARTICNRSFAAVERYGLVWSGESPVGELPTVDVLEGADHFGLRNLPVNASAELVIEMLHSHGFQPNAKLDDSGAETLVRQHGDLALEIRASVRAHTTTVVFFVQPVDASRSVIRPVMLSVPDLSTQIDVLRHHNATLTELRDRIETESAHRPTPQPMQAVIEQAPIRDSEVSVAAIGRRKAPLRVQVARKWITATDIVAIELESIDGQLPTFQPGAHIDVHLPNGLVRQYSLINGPGELTHYRIGVKLEPNSRGGSSSLHETIRQGDVLAISEPRNNFPLRRDTLRTILIAGGIGVTPLLAMAQALHHGDLNYELHYFAQADDHVAFGAILGELGDAVHTHLGLSPQNTGTELQAILAQPGHAEYVYVCGPGPMLEATRRVAADRGWPDAAVHFEYFKNSTEIDSTTSFKVNLARSALTLRVGSGQTILEVLHQSGVSLGSSCEQGACGTCSVAVLDGEPLHQDVYLSEAEKELGDQMMVCVSRTNGKSLTLDI